VGMGLWGLVACVGCGFATLAAVVVRHTALREGQTLAPHPGRESRGSEQEGGLTVMYQDCSRSFNDPHHMRAPMPPLSPCESKGGEPGNEGLEGGFAAGEDSFFEEFESATERETFETPARALGDTLGELLLHTPLSSSSARKPRRGARVLHEVVRFETPREKPDGHG